MVSCHVSFHNQAFAAHATAGTASVSASRIAPLLTSTQVNLLSLQPLQYDHPKSKSAWRRHWIPIEQPRQECDALSGTPSEAMLAKQETLAVLRTLSQTCRSLRAYALALLWEVIHVDKVSELGRIREVLRASPDIGRHIRSFVFLWGVRGWCENIDYAPKEITLLDLAFSDRMRLWTDLKEKRGCCDSWSADVKLYFRYQGIDYYAPGQSGTIGYREDGTPIYSPASPRTGGSGPDRKGEDEFIKSSQQCVDTLVEVVSQLKGLETFGWSSPILAMPVGVLGALEELTTLSALHVDFWDQGKKCPVHNCELLKHLTS